MHLCTVEPLLLKFVAYHKNLHDCHAEQLLTDNMIMLIIIKLLAELKSEL